MIPTIAITSSSSTSTRPKMHPTRLPSISHQIYSTPNISSSSFRDWTLTRRCISTGSISSQLTICSEDTKYQLSSTLPTPLSSISRHPRKTTSNRKKSSSKHTDLDCLLTIPSLVRQPTSMVGIGDRVSCQWEYGSKSSL